MEEPKLSQIAAAVSLMHSGGAGAQKKDVHKQLESFQKSRAAWTSVGLLTGEQPVEVKLFAATTIKGKIIYDLDELQSRSDLLPLRDTLLTLLGRYANGPRPLRTTLCVCLANLAIQMTEWKDVLQHVATALGSNATDSLLEFLRVLPEEVTEGRKINLSEDDLQSQSQILLEGNAPQVLQLLVGYAKSSPSAVKNPRLLECITSWLREIPAGDVVKSPLMDVIINALSAEETFDAGVDCMSTLYRDTRDVDESLDVIRVLYPKVLSLRPKIASAAASEDADMMKGVTRLFAEAGEAWVVLIARLPSDFRGLVEAILECCARDSDQEAVGVTFNFWYDFKQMITVDKYMAARSEFLDVFSRLVDVMIRHLQYPQPTGANKDDLFDGDREQEDKFREFRHQMGDVLKDCCEVISVSECLNKSFDLIKSWAAKYAAQATENSVPHWQELEAPLFALRAMGRMVPKDESVVLPQVIPLIVQVPHYSKLRFQAIMAIARYTEWTAEHPQYLQPQLQYVISALNESTDSELLQAAALAFKFFGSDCRHLLKDELQSLHGFYEAILDKLLPSGQDEVTEGVAHVIAVQPKDHIYAALKLYCDPIVERLKVRATKAQAAPDDKELQRQVADCLALMTIYITNVQPHYDSNETHQAVQYWQSLMPVLAALSENFPKSPPILERLCRCLRYMVFSYRTATLPLLPSLAPLLASGFATTQQGCFLWATDAVLREFSVGASEVDAGTSQAVYSFFESQAFAFLNVMNELPPQDLPDVIEDFFRLLVDALIYYHDQLLPAAILTPIFTASLSALSLEQIPPLTATLHFLHDLLSYGTDHPHSSGFANSNDGADASHQSQGTGSTSSDAAAVRRAANQEAVKALIAAQGEALVQRLLTGMMFHFPRDCLQDASGTLLALFELAPVQTGTWLRNTLALLPAGSVKPGEAERLLSAVAERLQTGQLRRIRVLLQDFTTSYRRRNVAPREGLQGVA